MAPMPTPAPMPAPLPMPGSPFDGITNVAKVTEAAKAPDAITSAAAPVVDKATSAAGAVSTKIVETAEDLADKVAKLAEGELKKFARRYLQMLYDGNKYFIKIAITILIFMIFYCLITFAITLAIPMAKRWPLNREKRNFREEVAYQRKQRYTDLFRAGPKGAKREAYLMLYGIPAACKGSTAMDTFRTWNKAVEKKERHLRKGGYCYGAIPDYFLFLEDMANFIWKWILFGWLFYIVRAIYRAVTQSPKTRPPPDRRTERRQQVKTDKKRRRQEEAEKRKKAVAEKDIVDEKLPD